MLTRNEWAARLAVMVLASFAGACGSLLSSDQPAAQTWWLEPPELTAPAAHEEQSRLLLRMSVAPGLDTDEVMTLNPEARFSPYAGAHWADRLPELLDSLLSRGLESSGAFSRVSDWSDREDPPCRLSLQAVRFYTRLDGNNDATSVEVAFEGRYRCEGEARAVKAAASVPVKGNRMPEVVAAYQAGLQQAAQGLLEQL